ncbi:hypothetical protein QMK33_21305 [Hymenobacter sp. H14-R3]|uniref:hypothetical protein n=1 Tax=Hymenobacter sp. H14-R3 TaxID=3046308 RepID=UPI0024BA58E1|nr:hypothetical protein [Hymenobacter sp. H14-R3]MDJ0367691.1 hypothetical protein [Hymenobacter sp. H14-R3]
MESPKRKAGRPRVVDPVEQAGPSLKITTDADRQLTQQAKKLKMSKHKYASAAISFFAQNGLDPTKEMPAGLAVVGQKVEAGVSSVRVHNADIGNRLYALVRGFEKTIYQFMQQQQHATYGYLEVIESNLLKHFVAVETNLLNPMIEQIVKGSTEAYVGRVVGERTMLKVLERDMTDWAAQNKKLSGERDEMIVKALGKFVEDHKMPTPRSTVKPGATPVPAKPVAPVATVPPATPKS